MLGKVAGALFGAAMLLLGSVAALGQPAGQGEFTEEFPVEDCTFLTQGGTNEYFILDVGRALRYDNSACVEAGECVELEELVITVLPETRRITFEVDGEEVTVRARVVEERETADGELAEVSRNFFAECKDAQDVYYFGEEVDIFEDGEIVSHEGAWLAGENDAMPGIIFPGGAFLLGSRYFQEIAPEVALDRAEHVDMGFEVEVPAGMFEDCVEVVETTPLDRKEASTKVYCRGTGLVIDDDLELVEIVDD